MRVFQVCPEIIEEVWDDFKAQIESALTRSSEVYTSADIRDGIKEGRFQLWGVQEDGKIYAVVVTLLLQYPQKKVCQIMIAVGERREAWQHMISVVEDWARVNGCDLIKPVARPGWRRVLEPLGYRQTHVVLEKDLK